MGYYQPGANSWHSRQTHLAYASCSTNTSPEITEHVIILHVTWPHATHVSLFPMITILTDSVHYDSFHLPSSGPHHNSSSHFVFFGHFSFKARRIEQTAVMGMLSLHDSCAGPDAALTFILCSPYTEERQTVSFYLFSFSVECLRPENVPGNQNFTQWGKEMLTLKHRK